MFQTSKRIYYSKYKDILFTLSYLNNRILKPPYFKNIKSQKISGRIRGDKLQGEKPVDCNNVQSFITLYPHRV